MKNTLTAELRRTAEQYAATELDRPAAIATRAIDHGSEAMVLLLDDDDEEFALVLACTTATWTWFVVDETDAEDYWRQPDAKTHSLIINHGADQRAAGVARRIQ